MTQTKQNRYRLKSIPVTTEADFGVDVDDSDGNSDSNSDRDSDGDLDSSEGESDIGLMGFCRELSLYAKRAASGDDEARRALRVFVISKYEYDKPLEQFTLRIGSAIGEVAVVAQNAAEGDAESLEFMRRFLEITPESDVHSETDETTDETTRGFNCTNCGNIVMQERNSNKPCGRTKFFMDFKQCCSSCRPRM
jgi:hypothetical protein